MRVCARRPDGAWGRIARAVVGICRSRRRWPFALCRCGDGGQLGGRDLYHWEIPVAGHAAAPRLPTGLYFEGYMDKLVCAAAICGMKVTWARVLVPLPCQFRDGDL